MIQFFLPGEIKIFGFKIKICSRDTNANLFWQSGEQNLMYLGGKSCDKLLEFVANLTKHKPNLTMQTKPKPESIWDFSKVR